MTLKRYIPLIFMFILYATPIINAAPVTELEYTRFEASENRLDITLSWSIDTSQNYNDKIYFQTWSIKDLTATPIKPTPDYLVYIQYSDIHGIQAVSSGYANTSILSAEAPYKTVGTVKYYKIHATVYTDQLKISDEIQSGVNYGSPPAALPADGQNGDACYTRATITEILPAKAEPPETPIDDPYTPPDNPFIIPETPYGSIMAVAAMLAGLVLYGKLKV
jgi:hypothetical protein